MADHPGLSAKDGQALVDKLAEVSTNMRQAASLADSFAQSVAQLFPGTVSAPQPTIVTGKKRGRVPKEGKRVKDPNAPKRPATSYIMFQNDIRDELRRKHPELPYKELLGKVSEAWGALGEDQKKAYQNVADTNMAKYNRAVIDYKGALNGHAAAVIVSAAPTPEADEADDDEEEEEEEEVTPPTKKSKRAAPVSAPVIESEEDTDGASSVSDESEDTPAAPPPPPVKASKPASSAKEKKKSKK